MKKGIVIGIIIGAILFGGIGVYASIKYNSNEITYKDTNVEDALNTLYEHRINEEILSGWQATSKRPSGFSLTASVPNISETDNVVTINNKSASGSQGTVYKKIENIEKYKYILLNISGSAKNMGIYIVEDVTNDQFPYVKNPYWLKYLNEERTVYSNVFVDVSNLTGTYYLVFAGTYVSNLTLTAKGIY